ncbi:sensor histidine kinase [Shewanella sedimentimangrovi]|uniref:histidine kinase n=1 Tax=Shewanella sedimentimangrovi TaxID=2814293 RepID=A0ABX7QXW8_9GAMM|nr:ATP-binding protein [Shewanella sedimentimangrovi]QSX36079.1 PAS domain-containing protein [Shewanella sedimentimangrovi]
MSAKPQAQVSEFPALQVSSLRGAKANAVAISMDEVLHAMPSGVVILDGNGVVRQANPMAAELLGMPLVAERWLSIINRAFAPREDDGHEVSLRNGRRVKLAITPLLQTQGQLIVLTDLTETRLLQKHVAHLQRLSALGKMVATLAHQIRTPLAAALLYASNLGSAKLTAESSSRFRQKLVDRLNELERQVNDMLLMAKGRHEAMGERTQLAPILATVMDNCAPLAQRSQAQLQLIDSSQGQILANANALGSAINNLLMNSLEAGASRIEVRAEDTEGQVLLTVTDNGKGLEPALQQKVLEPFYTTKAQGTGLGLAVVQTVVRNHGGEFNMQCAPGQGCCVTLRFPLVAESIKEEVNHG